MIWIGLQGHLDESQTTMMYRSHFLKLTHEICQLMQKITIYTLANLTEMWYIWIQFKVLSSLILQREAEWKRLQGMC